VEKIDRPLHFPLFFPGDIFSPPPFIFSCALQYEDAERELGIGVPLSPFFPFLCVGKLFPLRPLFNETVNWKRIEAE